MLKNKWTLSSIVVILLSIFLYINLENNSLIQDETNTNLENVTNEEMEIVITQNPNIFPMRRALANRYFEEFDYSSALGHFMYIVQNSNDTSYVSFSLAQIGWMVYESGDKNTALRYIEESIKTLPTSSIAKTYKGIIFIQDETTRFEGKQILTELLLNSDIALDDKKVIEEILNSYEN